MEIVWVIIGIVVVVGIIVLFRPQPSASEPTDCDPCTGIPEGREDEYKVGVDPLQSDKPVMYTLHTCRHCSRLKEYLAARGVFIQEVYLDDFAQPARKTLLDALKKYNPRCSFPTLVLPDGRFVIGFREEAVKKLFGWTD